MKRRILPKKMFHIWQDIFSAITFFAIILIIFESVHAYAERFFAFFQGAEIFIVAIFALEYGLSFFSAAKKFRYMFGFVGIIDLLAFLPTVAAFFYPPAVALKPLRVLKIIRVMRLVRIHKENHFFFLKKGKEYSNGTVQSWYTVRAYFFALFSSVIVFGTLMYLIERDIAETPFTSIPQGMWWAMVTLATVGYGDIVPHTVLGRIVAAFVMISGLILFALLVSIARKVAEKVILGRN